MLNKAIAMAATLFVDKKDKGGKPYILHCLYVMDKVKDQSEDVQVAAVLHDIIEDCGPDITYYDLKASGFSDKVINLLKLLTHDSGTSYEDYIKQIGTHPEARLIKMADLEHNSSILRLKGVEQKDLDRVAKYHKAYYYLKNIG